MIQRLRRTVLASLLAAATVASLVWPSAALLFHDGSDDPDCRVVIVVHDHAAHRLAAGPRSSPTTPEHCFLCHWQSLRTIQTVFHVPAPLAAAQSLARLDSVHAADVNTTRQPARAPPLA
jgi:hypothetical protein